MTDKKTFPLINSTDKNMPMEIAEEVYKEYSARYGTSQSLERLGERGGFGQNECIDLLYKRIKRINKK